MPVVDNQTLKNYALPGLDHRTFAGPDQGLTHLEVWGQVIAPGAGTPVHRHACEEAIVILEGSGTLTINGEDTRFGPDSTLVIPADAVHQIVNSGDTRMVIVAALGMAPVQVRHADNQAMPSRGRPARPIRAGRKLSCDFSADDWMTTADDCPVCSGLKVLKNKDWHVQTARAVKE